MTTTSHGGTSKMPAKLKEIRGTAPPKKLDSATVLEFPVIKEIPTPPEWLKDVEAIKEFQRLAPILVATGLLTTAGLSGFAILCAVHGKLVNGIKRNKIPTGHMLAQYRSLINDFGLTPLAQMKVKPAGQQRQNKFSNNGKRDS